MSAPIHADMNPLPRYAPKRCLPEWAAQTSELLAVRGEIGTWRGLLSDVSYQEEPTQLQRRLTRSLDPEFLPPPPPFPRFRWRLSASLVTALCVIAGAYFSASERPHPGSTAARQQASDRSVNSASPPGSPGAAFTKSTATEVPRLHFRGWDGAAPAPADIHVHEPAYGLTILLNAMLPGTRLSSEFGADGWPVSATNAVSNTRDNPVNDVIGILDRVPNRWPSIDWSAISQVIPNSGWAQQPSVAPPPIRHRTSEKTPRS
jgi:hypothetical protein